MTEDKYIIEVKRLRSQMVAIAMRYLGNLDDAEDATQDALLKLWAMHEMLRGHELERIAFTILKRLCIDRLRQREYRRGVQTVCIDNIDIAMEADNHQETEERERQLMAAVGKLPSRQRLLLQMRYLKGKDVHTIAQIIGSTEGSINMALSRARNKVYQLMATVVVVACMVFIPICWKRSAPQGVVADVPVKVDETHQDDSQEDVEPLINPQATSHDVACIEPKANAEQKTLAENKEFTDGMQLHYQQARTHQDDSREGVEPQTDSQVNSHDIACIEPKANTANAEHKTLAENKEFTDEIQLHYQHVLSESHQQTMPDEDMNPEFYALCAYAAERAEALSSELVRQCPEGATHKTNATKKYDDL